MESMIVSFSIEFRRSRAMIKTRGQDKVWVWLFQCFTILRLITMKTYLDNENNIISSPEGHKRYHVKEDLNDMVSNDYIVNDKVAFVTYQGISPSDVVMYHLGRGVLAPFHLHTSDFSWYFLPDGSLDYKKRITDLNENLQIEEEFDVEDQLLRGTAFVIEDGRIRFAVEFDHNRFYFNCYDFVANEPIPVDEVRHLIP